MSKLNKIVTNYPVTLTQEEVENLSETLSAVVTSGAFTGEYLSANALNSLSGNWEDTYNVVSSNSADWTSAWNEVSGFTYYDVEPDTWNDTYSAVHDYSASWNNSKNVVTANSSYWDNSYIILTANSGTWNGKQDALTYGYTTANNISAINSSALSTPMVNVLTNAGITDIICTASLPNNPDPSVLYLVSGV